jgi:hypothetical protein
MQAIDFTKLQVYHYLIGGGVVIAVIAVLLYLVPGAKLKVPAVLLAVFGSFGAGLGAGVVGMGLLGYHTTALPPENHPETASSTADGQGTPRGSAMMGRMGMGGGGMGKAGGGMGKAGGGMGGGPRGPTPKAQLAGLVTKLDQLTSRSLALELKADEKAKVRDQLRGLSDPEKLSDDEAKKRLDALLDALKNDKETLEAAGYRWPAQGGAMMMRPPPSDPPNPFKEGQNAEHLKALQERLAKG